MKIVCLNIDDFVIQKKIVELKPSENVDVMVRKNPALQKLIDTLNLVPEK